MHDPQPLTVNQILQHASPADKQYRRIQWHNTQISVRKFLDVGEVADLVRLVMDMIINYEKKIFAPELKEFAIRAAVVGYYAVVEMPETLEDQYRVIMTTDLYDVVCKSINQIQLQSIRDAVQMGVSAAIRATI